MKTNNNPTKQPNNQTLPKANKQKWEVSKFYVVEYLDLQPREEKTMRNKISHKLQLTSNDYNYAKAFVGQEGLENLQDLQVEMAIMDLMITKRITIISKGKQEKLISYQGKRETYKSTFGKEKTTSEFPLGKVEKSELKAQRDALKASLKESMELAKAIALDQDYSLEENENFEVKVENLNQGVETYGNIALLEHKAYGSQE